MRMHKPPHVQVKQIETSENGDVCPFCSYFNAPMGLNTCAHFVGFVWDGQFDVADNLTVLQNYWKEVIDQIDGKTVEALIQDKSLGNFEKEIMSNTHTNSIFLDLVTNALGAECGEGWSTDGMLGGAGYNVYLRDVQIIEKANSFLKELINQRLS